MPKDYSGKEPIGWFTVKGVHIPIYDGETKADAVERLKKQFEQPQKSKKKYNSFGPEHTAQDKAVKFFDKASNSNHANWEDELNDIEIDGIRTYTNEPGSYEYINADLYDKGYKKITDKGEKFEIKVLEDAINKHELYKGVTVTRQSDLRMLGFNDRKATVTEADIKKQLSKTYGHLQYKAFLSSSADDSGRDIAGRGVIVHIKVPPSKGAGAYIPRQSAVYNENEFLFNRNAVLKYDLTTLRQVGSKWEITAEWVGQAPD